MTPEEVRQATIDHIQSVRGLLNGICAGLQERGDNHDRTKLESPEREVFEEYTAKLAGTTYGSEEYKHYLEEMKPALRHHYLHNRHHPEHHVNGVDDMNLIDIVEMFCDWLAATKRHDDGNIHDSIAHNTERFGLTPQLASILSNTADWFEE